MRVSLWLLLLVVACKGTDPEDTEAPEDTDCPPVTWYADGDGDGFGDASSPETGCEAPEGALLVGEDCDDADPAAFPGAEDPCDGVDQDCDGLAYGPRVDHEDGGVWTDLTASFGAGTETAPAEIELPASGTVHVCEGTWYVALHAAGGSVAVEGQGEVDAVVLDGGGLSRVLDVDEGASVEVSGVTITHGVGVDDVGWGVTAGGGVLSQGSLDLHDAVVAENSAGHGAGIAATGPVVLTDVVIAANSAENAGGGVMVRHPASDGIVFEAIRATFDHNIAGAGGGGLSVDIWSGAGGVRLEDCDFTGNWTEGGDGGGAGLTLATGAAALVGCSFAGNTAGRGGGLQTLYGTVSIAGCAFDDNVADSHGGALSFQSSLTVSDTTMTGNRASQNGGAVYANGTAAAFDGVTMTDNRVDLLEAAEGEGGAVFAMRAPLTFIDTTITGSGFDAATDHFGHGGAVSLWASPSTFTGGALTGNDAHTGGAFAVVDCALDLVGAQITDNVAVDGGGGLLVRYGSKVTCGGSGAILRNAAGGAGGGVWLDETVTTGSYTSDGCDHGTGADDNTAGGASSDVGTAVGASSYGDDASFSCTVAGCL